MKLKLSIVLCSLAFAVSGCSSWIYGDSNQPTPAALPTITNQISTAILWKKNLGDGGEKTSLTLHPAAIGNTIYAVSADGNSYSLNGETGQENYHIKLGNGIVGGISSADNHLLVGTQNGDLIALSAADGQTIWRTPLNGQMLAPAAYADNLIAAHTSSGEIIALNPTDGSILWRYHGNNPGLTLRESTSPIVGGGVVIVTTDDGFFTVLDAKTGLPIANKRVVNATDHQNTNAVTLEQTATPQINNATLFGSAYQQLIYAIDLKSGEQKWANNSTSSAHDFAISPTELYLSTPTDNIIALNQSNGQELWRNEELRGRQLSPPVAIPGRVGIVDFAGYLSWLDASTGKLLGITQIGKTRAAASALVLDNAIIWQLEDGQLIAVRPQ